MASSQPGIVGKAEDESSVRKERELPEAEGAAATSVLGTVRMRRLPRLATTFLRNGSG